MGGAVAGRLVLAGASVSQGKSSVGDERHGDTGCERLQRLYCGCTRCL